METLECNAEGGEKQTFCHWRIREVNNAAARYDRDFEDWAVRRRASAVRPHCRLLVPGEGADLDRMAVEIRAHGRTARDGRLWTAPGT